MSDIFRLQTADSGVGGMGYSLKVLVGGVGGGGGVRPAS